MNSSLKDRLTEALDDEYKALAAYRKVIEKFGPIRPFVNIVEAEARHAAALLSLFERYGIPVPEDRWPERVTAPDTVEEACRSAVEAEYTIWRCTTACLPPPRNRMSAGFWKTFGPPPAIVICQLSNIVFKEIGKAAPPFAERDRCAGD